MTNDDIRKALEFIRSPELSQCVTEVLRLLDDKYRFKAAQSASISWALMSIYISELAGSLESKDMLIDVIGAQAKAAIRKMSPGGMTVQ